MIVETDDDNHPEEEFWAAREIESDCRPVRFDGWVNVYSYFSKNFIYPRGMPLPHARDEPPAPGASGTHRCLVQQGLADADPDVDATYRMLYPLPFDFDPGMDPVVLENGAWCPFNSQNTTFFAEAFPLLYLPTECSFRMTDIWRGFVAQRILHAKGAGVQFHGPTVRQERNDHDLHNDFLLELPGYEHNREMREALVSLSLDPSDSFGKSMELCYETLIGRGWVGKGEEALLAAWLTDLDEIT